MTKTTPRLVKKIGVYRIWLDGVKYLVREHGGGLCHWGNLESCYQYIERTTQRPLHRR